MRVSARAGVVWAVFAVLVGVVVYLETRAVIPEIPSEEKRRMFAFREAELGQVDLFYQGRLATLMRSPGGLWFLHDSSHSHSSAAAPGSPEAAAPGKSTAPAPPSPARVTANEAKPFPEAPQAKAHTEPDSAKAAKLASSVDFLSRMIFDRRIQPTQPLKEYGLENPAVLILFYRLSPEQGKTGVPTASLYVGDTITTGYAYYAQMPGDRDITLIPLYQVDTLVQAAFGIDPHPAMKKTLPGELKN